MKNNNMDEIILQLLKENGRIILPDFGALIVKQKSPFIVIFNEFLQYNDGVLVSAVEKQLQISKEDAGEKVKNLIGEFNSKLDKGDEIHLPGAGFLSKSTAGKITLSEVSVKNVLADVRKTKVQEDKIPEVEFDLSAEKPVDKKPVEAKKEIQKTPEKVNVKEPVKSEPVIKPQTEKKVTAPIKEEVKKSQEIKEPVRPPINEYYNNQPEKNVKNIIIWAVIVVIINGSLILGYIYLDEIKMFLNKKGTNKSNTENITNTPEVPQTTEDTASIESVVPELTEVESQAESEEFQSTPIQSAGTKYYIVAGAFRNEANADKLVLELRKKGFNAEKFGKIGHMFAVSYGVFPSKSEADSYLYKIKNETDPEAWIKIVD